MRSGSPSPIRSSNRAGPRNGSPHPSSWASTHRCRFPADESTSRPTRNIERFGLPCDVANNDIYGSGFADEILSVKTAYEQMFLERKLPITYTRFSLGERRDFPPFDWEGDDTDEKDNEEARKNDISDRTSRSSYANP